MNEIHPDRIDMNLLRLFHRIYVERSVGSAAIHLGMTPSAASHGLKRLRLLFNDLLFVRTGLRMTPTPRADALFEPVQAMMYSLEHEILSVATFNPALAKRQFALSIGDMGEMVFLPPLLKYMGATAPSCTLRCRRIPNESVSGAMENGDVELAIGIFPEFSGRVYQKEIFSHDYVVLAWKEHPRIKHRLTWAAYQREDHIVVDSGSDRNLQRHTLDPMGIKRNVRLKLDGFLSLPWIIRGTDLIATVPSRLSEDVAQAASLKQFELPQTPKPYRLQLMWLPRFNNDPGHRWLREALFELMKGYPNGQLDL